MPKLDFPGSAGIAGVPGVPGMYTQAQTALGGAVHAIWTLLDQSIRSGGGRGRRTLAPRLRIAPPCTIETLMTSLFTWEDSVPSLHCAVSSLHFSKANAAMVGR